MKKSNEFIYIVSPYLKVCERYRAILKDVADHGKDIRIIYGKTDINKNDMDWINSIDRIGVYFWKNLHAKCYMNEKMAVITSMNLYEYSMVNNYEMGIVIYRDQDSETYDDLLDEVQRLMRISTIKKSPTEPEPESKRNMSKKYAGYCIRCSQIIPYNPEKPYCNLCLKSWNKYKNPDYIEKKGVCHSCNNKLTATMNAPICETCLKKNDDCRISLC